MSMFNTSGVYRGPGYGPGKGGGGGVGLVYSVKESPTNLFNAYRPGAGVGASTLSVQRALKRRASLKPGKMSTPEEIETTRTRGLCCHQLQPPPHRGSNNDDDGGGGFPTISQIPT